MQLTPNEKIRGIACVTTAQITILKIAFVWYTGVDGRVTMRLPDFVVPEAVTSADVSLDGDAQELADVSISVTHPFEH